MRTDPSGFVWWVLGPAIGAVVAAFGHAHGRINKIEQTMDDGHKAADEARDRDEDRIWQAIDRLRGDTVEFQRQVLSGMATHTMVSELRQEVRELARIAKGNA